MCSQVSPQLKILVARLVHEQDLNEESVARILNEVPIELADVTSNVSFSVAGYKRNFVYDSENLQVLVLCWLPGQASGIHDHCASYCGVRVVSGCASETVFQGGSEEQMIDYCRVLHCGDVVTSRGSFIHRIANTQPSELITLHVYTPPLVKTS